MDRPTNEKKKTKQGPKMTKQKLTLGSDANSNKGSKAGNFPHSSGLQTSLSAAKMQYGNTRNIQIDHTRKLLNLTENDLKKNHGKSAGKYFVSF